VRCYGSRNCLPHDSIYVTVELLGVTSPALNASEHDGLCSALAREIATACGAEDEAVVDMGGSNGSVTMDESGLATAFVLGIQDLSASDLASRLYSDDFVKQVESALSCSTRRVLVAAVSMQPKQFATMTTTKTVTATTSTTSTTGPMTTTAAPARGATTQAASPSSTTSVGSGAVLGAGVSLASWSPLLVLLIAVAFAM